VKWDEDKEEDEKKMMEGNNYLLTCLQLAETKEHSVNEIKAGHPIMSYKSQSAH
jgi:hypothetical protein